MGSARKLAQDTVVATNRQPESKAQVVFASYVPSESPDNVEKNLVEIDASHVDLERDSLLADHRLKSGLSPLKGLDLLSESATIWDRLVGDQSHFYSNDSLLNLGLLVGAGAAVANTDLDNQLQKHFQSSVRGASSNGWFEYLHANKELGNGRYSLPIMGAAWLANEYIDGPPAFEAVGLWGERSIRGFLVGAAPMLALQRLTGGSRPYETLENSEWHPLRDNNGVSGHAFMSSLPFITAAKMTDSPWQKTLWYAGSTLGPLSRVNDNAHYPSQIGIGWGMAFLAASAVHQTDTGKPGWSLVPQSSLTSNGVGLQYRW